MTKNAPVWKRCHEWCVRKVCKTLLMLQCQAGMNLVQSTSQRDETVLCQTGLNLAQKASSNDDTYAVSGWLEPRPEYKSKSWHCYCVRLVQTSSIRQVKEMTMSLCQAGMNLVQNTSQRDDTVAVSDWFEPRSERKLKWWHLCCVRLVGTSTRRQVKEMTLSLCQAGLNLAQKASSNDDTSAVSGWFEPRPEYVSKRWHCRCVRLVWTSSRVQAKGMALSLCQAGLNLVQKTSQRYDTVVLPG